MMGKRDVARAHGPFRAGVCSSTMLVLGRPRALVLLAAIVGASEILGVPHRAFAEEPVGPTIPDARRHFENARTLYGHGAYREALAELQAAHAIDPSAKDLVFNLGVVEEKLGDIDEALRWFQTYTTMALTPQERERADAYVRRLEGAKHELEHTPSTEPVSPSTAGSAGAPASEPPISPPGPARGRIDAATVVAGGVAVTALAFGAVVGVKALVDDPTQYTTGRDGTYLDLLNRSHMAHEEAVISDVGFSVALAAGVTATLLYLMRTRHAASPTSTAARSSPTISAAPLTGGAGFFVQGSL